MTSFAGRAEFHDPTVTQDIGRTSAIVLQHLHFQSSTHSNWAEGRQWYFGTLDVLSESLGLSTRTIKRAIARLKKCGYLLVQKRESKFWYHRNWYAICYEEAAKHFDVSRWGDFSPKSGPIEGDNVAPSYTKYSKPINKRTNTEVVEEVDHQEKEANQRRCPPPIKRQEQKTPEAKPKKQECKAIDPNRIERLKQILPIGQINNQIRQLSGAANFEDFETAIAVVKQNQARGKVFNLPGLFVKALKNKWKPSIKKGKPKGVPPDFNEWYDLAKELGHVTGSQTLEGRLHVLDRARQPQEYAEFRSIFSLSYLQKELIRLGRPESVP